MREMMREMPKYKCSKEVWALKIKGLELFRPDGNSENDGSYRVEFEDEGYSPMCLSKEYMQKHNPKVGGYYVVYKDGYSSFSPPEAFESGYTLIK